MKKLTNNPHTIEIPFESVPTRFKELLRNLAQTLELGNIETGIHECFVTKTDVPKLLFGKKTIYLVICFHDDFLLWSSIQDKESDGIALAKWSELSEVTEWEDSKKTSLADLHGVEIFGFLYKSSHRSMSFLSIDKSVSGLKCRRMLKERIGNK